MTFLGFYVNEFDGRGVYRPWICASCLVSGGSMLKVLRPQERQHFTQAGSVWKRSNSVRKIIPLRPKLKVFRSKLIHFLKKKDTLRLIKSFLCKGLFFSHLLIYIFNIQHTLKKEGGIFWLLLVNSKNCMKNILFKLKNT